MVDQTEWPYADTTDDVAGSCDEETSELEDTLREIRRLVINDYWIKNYIDNVLGERS